MKEQKFDEEELEELIGMVRAGDNSAWTRLYEILTLYVTSRIYHVSNQYVHAVNEDLVQEGLMGAVSALRRFDPEKGKFLTFATWYIDGEIKRELAREYNNIGYAQLPAGSGRTVKITLDDENVNVDALLSRVVEDFFEDSPSQAGDESPARPVSPVSPAKESGTVRTALQIMKILRLVTDEKHTLSKKDLETMIPEYRRQMYNEDSKVSEGTIKTMIDEILLEVDPIEYTGDNDDKYLIKYSGYKDNALRNNLQKKKGTKAQSITDFSYNHALDYRSLDSLLQIVCLSGLLSDDEKQDLVKRLTANASIMYESPFWNGDELRFSSNSIHGRYTTANSEAGVSVRDNIRIIQDAINRAGQIQFHFNDYTAEHTLEPKHGGLLYKLSPYHLVVYHDKYYCIGLVDDDLSKMYGNSIWHFRIDLMSDIELIRGKDARILTMKVAPFEGLPIANANWDPEKYMAEHMNMGFDNPRDVLIKIADNRYNTIHEWFGEYFEKTDDPCEPGYDIIRVKAPEFMIIRWALQYGNSVEILNEDLRDKICQEANNILGFYQGG